VIYPLGGGEGVIGIWKAVKEAIQLGLARHENLPRFIIAQPDTCAPVIEALESKMSSVRPWRNCRTLAAGLNVPKPYADYLLLDILRETRSQGYRISDREIIDTIRYVARNHGLFPSPESGAAYAAYRKALEDRSIDRDEIAVIIQTASGAKYMCEILNSLSSNEVDE
jgi:threonine synthase